MCGIAGIFDKNNADLHIEIKQMTDVLKHRGPDGEGFWHNRKDGVWLGHRRLSILDLSEKGKQPMSYMAERYTITFNGEIYNYIELKIELIELGYLFQSETDTEVLLALYDYRGIKCLDYLDGMFAFAIWDSVKKKLFCARDRFGEKPFYYFFDKERGFFFASEMKALWAVGIEKNIEPSMLINFITTNLVVDEKNQEKTFYNNVSQLDSSQYLTITIDNFQPIKKRYYSLDQIEIKEEIKKDAAKEEFIFLLEQSVRLRLRSDVPVGSSLSGGIDSSSIVMLIDKIKGDFNVQKTFSARFKDFDRDEGYYMKLVTDKCKTVEPYEVWPSKEDMEEVMDKVLYHQEEPFGSASIFAQWKVMELAKKSGITVLLDGQGADEQLAGYLYYYNQYLSQLYQNNYNLFLKEVDAFEKLRGLQHYLHSRSQSVKMKLGRIKRGFFKSSISISNKHLFNSLKHDMTVTGLKELLRYADRNSMAHSVEVRLPFLNHKLVEFVFSLPDSFKLKDGWTKMILRETMGNILPKEITWRVDKVAYETPQDMWLDKIKDSKASGQIKQYLSDFGILKNGYNIENISNWNFYLLLKMIEG